MYVLLFHMTLFLQPLMKLCHITTGIEWIDNGTYEIHNETPPLARIADALGPYLAGAKFVDSLVERNDVLV